jgi:hypothetical protein
MRGFLLLALIACAIILTALFWSVSPPLGVIMAFFFMFAIPSLAGQVR